VGDANRGEYITGFSERKRLLASLFFPERSFFSGRSANFFTAPYNHALTKFFVLSNIRFVSGGSGEMLRASRCFRITLLQSVGPLTLAADALQPCLQSTGFSLDRGAARNFSFARLDFFSMTAFSAVRVHRLTRICLRLIFGSAST
jgi:hypothetical protein